MTKPLQTPMLLSSCIFKIKTNVQCKNKHGKTRKTNILGYLLSDKTLFLVYFHILFRKIQSKANTVIKKIGSNASHELIESLKHAKSVDEVEELVR